MANSGVRKHLREVDVRPSYSLRGNGIMDWKLTTITYSDKPNRGKRAFNIETAFESAVREALADLREKIVSATLPDGTVLSVAELRRRYDRASRYRTRASPG